ncbi:response regulator transcription factor [Streptomyces sp. KMM 9044]|uniref:response regulator transcription factor n=1 Tax=Streptomyces sp. KMM 9044 TaxID=2744474 RepID=UPI002151BC5B|nr:response regulator transcription factor [Streptomyces sp. KMM 9044]WAX78220.1 response regulator transcription factor [Streptomyces sp. KMM 9044]
MAQMAQMATNQGPPPAVALRVLVADDNPVVRAGLTALLSGRGEARVVAEATDGQEACEAARDHHPDVILLDVRMPRMDGISALPYLVGIAPVVMLTYSGESETVEEALRRGAGGYLVHGEFTADELIAAVRGISHGRPHFTPAAAEALLAQLRRTPSGPPLPEGLGIRTDATAYELSKKKLQYMNPQQVLSPGVLSARRPTAPSASSQSLSQLQPGVGQSSSGWTSGRGPAVPGRSRFQLSSREAEIMDHIASGMNNQQIAATCFISEKTVKNHINRIFAKLHSTSRSEAAAKWLGTAPDSARGLG